MRACASEAPPECGDRSRRCASRPCRRRPRRIPRAPAHRDRPQPGGRFDERGGDRPIRQAGNIGAGAVDRVDDPDIACVRAAPDRRRFPPIASATPFPSALSRSRRKLSTAISASQTGEEPAFGPALDRRSEHRERELAGFAHVFREPSGCLCRIRDLNGRQRSDPRHARSARWCHSGRRDRSPE